jgi:hypothetical protein
MASLTQKEQGPDSSRNVAEYPLARGKLVLSLLGNTAAWVEPTLKRLTQLLNLSANWDSYQGKPVDPANAWAAWRILEILMQDHACAPTLVPTCRGTIQAEWHDQGIDLEIEVLSPQRLSVSYEKPAAPENWEEVFEGLSEETVANLKGLIPTENGNANGRNGQ